MVVTTVKASQPTIKDTIKHSINVLGDECNLNFIDTELITNMECMFDSSKFNGDISNWNVENVTDMKSMFYGCPLENRPEFQPKFKKEQYYDSNYSEGQSTHY